MNLIFNIMAKIIFSSEQQLNETKVLFENQKNKVFNYVLNDFIIDENNNFYHKNWKTKVKGGNSKSETIDIINRYIIECNKPYGKRNLNFIHLTN